MSRNRKSVKTIRKYYKIIGASIVKLKKLLLLLLRTLFVKKRKCRSANAGFVLPTVAMVSIVVVLLTTAIMFRSFERSKNASNIRVNEAALNAAAPAIERARAKINKLFQDPRLPRSTPSDLSLKQVIDDNFTQFTFGDETPLRLKITDSLKTNLGISSTLQNSERESNTAWKYPVDTDNNGKFDSYTLYGIYYKTPSTSTRSRIPVEARAQPMDGDIGKLCNSDIATSADLVGTQGWFRTSGRLKRSMFVYTTTVPITSQTLAGVKSTEKSKYEAYKGNRGFVALEYQQDRERIPLNNNAVLYEDDLEITPGRGLRVNGRIFTNGNLLTREPSTDNPVRFFLVSSDKSCYFSEENSKIIVAGNLINSRVNETTGGGGVEVDLFSRPTNAHNTGDADKQPRKPEINGTNKTVPDTVFGDTAAYNDEAYARRIDRLVEATKTLYPNESNLTSLPKEVQDEITRNRAADETLTYEQARDEQLRIYFRSRTRRIPYAEVPFGSNALKITGGTDYETTSPLEGSGETLRPVDAWVFPFDPADTTDATNFAKIGVRLNADDNKKIALAATDPEIQVTQNQETEIGDRILVGNNLPQYWFDSVKGKFVSSPDDGQDITGKQWNNNTKTRKRFSQAYQLDDLGITDRDDFWEKSAAQIPDGKLDVVGGMRVVTGAGIYLPSSITRDNADTDLGSIPIPSSPVTVWPDSMPMGVDVFTGTAPAGLPSASTPYLRMRSTVVYHYKTDTYDPKNPTYQTPTACISSYYDPTNATTAGNRQNLPDISLRTNATYRNVTTALPNVTATSGLSHNGIVYPVTDTSLSTSGYESALAFQAELKYPNGRWVNKQLRKAMDKRAASGNLTLAEQSAIDSAVCSLKIFDNSFKDTDASDAVIPHGVIMETAFLDARQVKSVSKQTNITPNPKRYDLDVELRQPLEIRATTIDLDLLRKKAIGTDDFLIPNSGIIYATREDALADESDANSRDVSATDFILDPTRRPNAILLINGSNLSRNSTYKPEEKGLILASNLPVYIQGNFNLHTQEEFSETLNDKANWDSFYKRTTLNSNFACRSGQFTGCSSGEDWRPASVIADSITVLSQNFDFGFRQHGDYDIRDNYGQAPIGYDFNGNGTIDSTAEPLNENALKLDLDGDGNMTTTTVNNWSEAALKTDFNNDGDTSDSIPITEQNITATAALRLSGFWDNSFVTSRNFQDSDYSGNTDNLSRVDSSYFNNVVTPIQRRVQFSEYLMEICPKATVAACKPDDWVVGYDLNGNASLEDNVTIDGITVAEKNIKANQLIEALANASIASIQTDRLRAGTTATPANNMGGNEPQVQSYPRRVAFLRHRDDQTVTRDGTAITGNSNELVLDSNTPVPLGIFLNSGTSNLEVKYFPYSNTLTVDTVNYSPYSSGNRPRTQANALWFRTNNSEVANYSPEYPLWIENRASLTGTQQPLLVPVLQIHYPFPIGADSGGATITNDANQKLNENTGYWMQRAAQTETNLVFAQGNTPSRPNETGGGLENFIRYLESWHSIKHTASGAFIQYKRSSYATAPWEMFTIDQFEAAAGYGSAGTRTILGYTQSYQTSSNARTVVNNFYSRSPFYQAPTRSWGYDAALLTQLPDLFSQRFTTPSTADPNEFFREVGRDDAWVKTLLCAAEDGSKTGAGYDAATDVGANFKYALSSDQRPGACR
jgi:hypothetical protein